jgi:hypothetical protein
MGGFFGFHDRRQRAAVFHESIRQPNRRSAVMSPEARTKIAEAWIEHSMRRIERDTENVFHEVRGKDNFLAFEELDHLCRHQPDVC